MGACFSTPAVSSVESSSPKRNGLISVHRSSDSLSTAAAAALQQEQKRDAELAALPCRTVESGALGACSLHLTPGKKGVNQDAVVVWKNFMEEDGALMCGVFDGHGPYGHHISQRVRDSLPSRLAEIFEALSMTSGKGGKVNAKRALQGEALLATWREAHLQGFRAVDQSLRTHPSLDPFCSGSTAVTAVVHQGELFVGNLGDSRCVLATGDVTGGGLAAIQLTEDMKPDNPEEKARIERAKGRVFPLVEDPCSMRVWLPNEDSPGLAMSRAFGDVMLKDYGVICEPQVFHRVLTAEDRFLVLASDGVWDVLSNEEVVSIVARSRRPTAAAAVARAAVKGWKRQLATSRRDDVSAVVLFLDSAELSSHRRPRDTGASEAASGFASSEGSDLGSDSDASSHGRRAEEVYKNVRAFGLSFDRNDSVGNLVALADGDAVPPPGSGASGRLPPPGGELEGTGPEVAENGPALRRISESRCLSYGDGHL